ncbi:MAG: TIGR04150 pseudo-rSAM protein [Tannerella sp.]|jgi:pseudo-rSAM protein|nr:TIGR04150 pseudo-rSAM protein [Tannerella sp.]
MKTVSDYWFAIEPYVFIDIKNKNALLYNTLDRATIESTNEKIIEILHDTLKEENCGVALLTNEQYQQKEVNCFICELREKFMGDVIDVSLSNGKPVQLLPFYNYSKEQEVYKKNNFSSYKNVLEKLFEISIHVDITTDITNLIRFLASIPQNLTLNIIGNIGEVPKYSELLSYLDQYSSPKNLLCSYENVIALQPIYENNFSYQITVSFPIDVKQWNRATEILLSQTLPFEFVFNVSSEDNIQQSEQLIEQYQIEKYKLKPNYTGNNIRFFEEEVFLSKEDILSTSMTIKDFFAHQAVNIYDFGKINIMPNGDTYANLNHPLLGNIYVNNIHEILHKEVEEGKSWLRIRNEAPCTDCVYQWICPPPSNYEIAIGRPNLCHVKE